MAKGTIYGKKVSQEMVRQIIHVKRYFNAAPLRYRIKWAVRLIFRKW